MREDLKKKFILLSKVAKEKKYAQEYLSLLARRGDLGSVRIGKRWYTTNEWMEEFIGASQKKKKAIKVEKIISDPRTEKRIAGAKDIGIRISHFPVAKKEKLAPVFSGQNEKKSFIDVYKLDGIKYSPKPAFEKRKKIISEAKEKRVPVHSVASSRDIFLRESNSPQKIRSGAEARQNFYNKVETKNPQRKTIARRESRKQSPFENIEINTRPGLTSPNFAGSGELQPAPFFRFAYAAAFVLLFFLFVSSAFIFRNELKVVILGEKEGKVAGAVSDRSGGEQEGSDDGLIQARTASGYYLANTSDRLKENLSFSHVMLKSAVARAGDNQQ